MKPSASTDESGVMVIRRVMVRINRSGAGLPDQASWPFTKFVVQPGLVTIKLFGTHLTFTPDSLAKLDMYSQHYAFGQPVGEHGVRILPKSPISTSVKRNPVVSVDVSFRSKDLERVIGGLQSCGFTVLDELQ